MKDSQNSVKEKNDPLQLQTEKRLNVNAQILYLY